MEPMISVNVDGDSESAWISGKALIDRIAARLSYSTGLEIRLKKEGILANFSLKLIQRRNAGAITDISRRSR